MERKSFINRAAFIFFLYYLGFIVLFINLFKIQVLQKEKWEKIAYRQYFSKEELMGKRGKILTVNGKEIAYDMESYQLILDPKFISDENIKELAEVFAENLDLNYIQLAKQILDKKNKGRRYLKIKEDILSKSKDEVLDRLKRGKTSREKRDIMSGIYFRESTTRIYPEWDLFKNVVGYTNSKKEGVYGVENSYDRYLRGAKGYSERFTSTYNKFTIPVLNDLEKIEAEDGNNVYLTIDYVIQHILDDSLYEMFKETKANWAAGIVINPKNGDILGMSSFPMSKTKSNVRNNVIYNQYEPGSVIKPIIVGMALDEGLIDLEELFYCKGYIRLYNVTIKDHDSSSIGYLDASKILEKSSNVGMVQIAQRFKNENFYDKLVDFGFDEKTGVDLSGERRIYLRNYKKWSGVSKATISFGQGIVSTPIHMAMAMASLVNGGKLYKPTIIDRVETSYGTILKKSEPDLKRRVISEKAAEEMKNIMKLVVKRGTGKNAAVEGYEIGGKTGTSQKSGGVSGYTAGKYISSFVGFFPVEDPEYLCLIVIDEPKGKKIYGGQIAAPVVKKVFERIIRHKNIIPKNIQSKMIYLENESYEIDSENFQEFPSDIMPDFRGKSLREAMMYLHNKEYEVVIKGHGKIKKQEPKPGTNLNKVRKIYLDLE